MYILQLTGDSKLSLWEFTNIGKFISSFYELVAYFIFHWSFSLLRMSLATNSNHLSHDVKHNEKNKVTHKKTNARNSYVFYLYKNHEFLVQEINLNLTGVAVFYCIVEYYLSKHGPWKRILPIQAASLTKSFQLWHWVPWKTYCSSLF